MHTLAPINDNVDINIDLLLHGKHFLMI